MASYHFSTEWNSTKFYYYRWIRYEQFSICRYDKLLDLEHAQYTS